MLAVNLTPQLTDILVNGASIMISPAAAKKILDECHYRRQRPLNEDRALLLSEAIEHGTFLQNTQLAFGRLNGRCFLVNGQHRVNAVHLSGMSQLFRIEIYECATLDHLGALYCRFDQPGGQRSLTQVAQSLGLHDEEGGLRPATAALLLRATPVLMTDLRRVAHINRPRSSRDLDVKKDYALRWKPWALQYQSCLDQGITSRTARYRCGSVTAVALMTLRHVPEKAKEFWSNSIRNSGLLASDPRYALHSHFLTSKRAKKEFDFAEAASFAWNAWYQGRALSHCRTLGAPIRLLGTPIQGEE